MLTRQSLERAIEPVPVTVTVGDLSGTAVFQFGAYTQGGLSVQLVWTPESHARAIEVTGKRRLSNVVAVLSTCYPPWPGYTTLGDEHFLLKTYDDMEPSKSAEQVRICVVVRTLAKHDM